MRDYIKIKGKPRKIQQKSFSRGADYFLDESVLPFGIAAECYNLEYGDGALRQSWGISKGTVENAKAVWDFKRFDFGNNVYVTVRMFMKDDGSVWYLDPDGGMETRLGSIAFTSLPTCVNYRLYGEDVVIMCSPTDRMVVWNGIDDPYIVPDSPFISSMAMHYERLFVTTEGEKNSVWFSDDLDPTNWNSDLEEGGYIQLIDDRGRCNKVISFLNYIYIFRDNGISRLTAFGEQREFYIGNLFVASGKIYPDSVTLCGDKIYFLASDGLYVFDGLSAKKIYSELDPIIEGGTPYGAYFDGKYFLTLRLKDSGRDKLPSDIESSDKEEEDADAEPNVEEEDPEIDDGTNNGLIVIGQDGYSLVRGVNIAGLSPTEEGLYASLYDGRSGLVDKSGAVFDMPLHKKWVMPQNDFGYVEPKILKEVRLYSGGPLSIGIYSDIGKKKFNLPKGHNRLFANVMGRIFKIIIESDEKSVYVNRLCFSIKR